ncbi:unnamed protein product [Closterium sp. NIES-54]
MTLPSYDRPLRDITAPPKISSRAASRKVRARLLSWTGSVLTSDHHSAPELRSSFYGKTPGRCHGLEGTTTQHGAIGTKILEILTVRGSFGGGSGLRRYRHEDSGKCFATSVDHRRRSKRARFSVSALPADFSAGAGSSSDTWHAVIGAVEHAPDVAWNVATAVPLNGALDSVGGLLVGAAMALAGFAVGAAVRGGGSLGAAAAAAAGADGDGDDDDNGATAAASAAVSAVTSAASFGPWRSDGLEQEGENGKEIGKGAFCGSETESNQGLRAECDVGFFLLPDFDESGLQKYFLARCPSLPPAAAPNMVFQKPPDNAPAAVNADEISGSKVGNGTAKIGVEDTAKVRRLGFPQRMPLLEFQSSLPLEGSVVHREVTSGREIPGRQVGGAAIQRQISGRQQLDGAAIQRRLFGRHCISTPDGGTLSLDFLKNWPLGLSQQQQQQQGRLGLAEQLKAGEGMMVVVVAGLAAGSADPFIQRLASSIAARGHVPVVLNLRGCGGSPGTYPRGAQPARLRWQPCYFPPVSASLLGRVNVRESRCEHGGAGGAAAGGAGGGRHGSRQRGSLHSALGVQHCY